MCDICIVISEIYTVMTKIHGHGSIYLGSGSELEYI